MYFCTNVVGTLYRERRDAGEPVRTVVRPKDRRARPKSGGPTPSTSSAPCRPNTRTGATSSPSPWADSLTAELLEGVCDVDLDAPRRRAAAGLRPRLRRTGRTNAQRRDQDGPYGSLSRWDRPISSFLILHRLQPYRCRAAYVSCHGTW